MLQKRLRARRKEYIYDKLHRGGVNTCMGITAVATVFFLYQGFVYFAFERPKLAALAKEESQKLITDIKEEDLE